MIVHYNQAHEQTKTEAMTRRMLASEGGLMMVEVEFHKASDDPGFHSHPHEQIAYVRKGKFEFIVDGVSSILTEGDSVYVKPNVTHGAKPLVDGATFLDVFTPQREDFL